MYIEEILVSKITFCGVCPVCQYEALSIVNLERLTEVDSTLCIVNFICGHCGNTWSEAEKVTCGSVT
jgi:hypothetical protein